MGVAPTLSPPEEWAPAEVGGRPPGQSLGSRALGPTLITLSVGVMFLLWLWASRRYSTFIFPSPAETWDSLADSWRRGVWWDSLSATVAHLLTAVALIIAIGL